jgi:hypothetical protein
MIRVAQVGLHIFYRPNPHYAALQQALAERSEDVEHAVLTSQPFAPATTMRVAPALLEKASDVTPPAPAPQAKSAESAGVPAASDAAAP